MRTTLLVLTALPTKRGRPLKTRRPLLTQDVAAKEEAVAKRIRHHPQHQQKARNAPLTKLVTNAARAAPRGEAAGGKPNPLACFFHNQPEGCARKNCTFVHTLLPESERGKLARPKPRERSSGRKSESLERQKGSADNRGCENSRNKDAQRSRDTSPEPGSCHFYGGPIGCKRGRQVQIQTRTQCERRLPQRRA